MNIGEASENIEKVIENLAMWNVHRNAQFDWNKVMQDRRRIAEVCFSYGLSPGGYLDLYDRKVEELE